jgi:hypothetical protein
MPFTETSHCIMKNARMRKVRFVGGIENLWLKWKRIRQVQGTDCCAWPTTSKHYETNRQKMPLVSRHQRHALHAER